MEALVESPKVAKKRGRPKKPGGDGAQVRIETDLATKARYLAAQEGIKLIDFLSQILRPTIERKFGKAKPKNQEGED